MVGAGEGGNPQRNPSLKLFSLETGQGDLGRVEVQGKVAWVVLLVPVLPAQGRVGRCWSQHGKAMVHGVNGWPTLPVTSASGPVGRSCRGT